MNESSVSTPLLTNVREQEPTWCVFKHADVGMKGLPDASVTGCRKTLWLEFKLHDPKKYGQWVDIATALRRFQDDAPVQADVMRSLRSAGRAFYVIWRKKVREVYVVDTMFGDAKPLYVMFKTTPEVARFIVDYVNERNQYDVVWKVV